MDNLINFLKGRNIVEICTIKQNYHVPALKKRNLISNSYKIVEINKFNINKNYKFNFTFSSFNQNISKSKLLQIKNYIENSDVVILHSWRGKLWNQLLKYSILLNKKIVFMNDMVNEYKRFSLKWFIRKVFDLEIRLKKNDNLYFIALNPLHENILSKRFGKVNILYHQWQYCYIKENIIKINDLNTLSKFNKNNTLKILFIGRNIPRKGINRFIEIAFELNKMYNSKLIFILAYSGKEIVLNHPNNMKIIKINSIVDNKKLYLDADILYCPFKNEPLGLVPLEGLGFGCKLLFDRTIPSMNEFKELAIEIPSSKEVEILLWKKVFQKIKKIKIERNIRRDKFINSLNKMNL